MSAGIDALRSADGRWATGTFAVGRGLDGREVNLWCGLSGVKDGLATCYVINGAWDFTVDINEPNTGRVVRYPDTVFTFNVLFHGMRVPFSRDKYGEAIAWMQAKVDAEVPK